MTGGFEVFLSFGSGVEVESEVDGSVGEDRVPSSTRIWRAERAKNEQIPLFYPLRHGCPAAGILPSLTSKGIVGLFEKALDYIQADGRPFGRPTGHAGCGPAEIAQAVTTHRPI